MWVINPKNLINWDFMMMKSVNLLKTLSNYDIENLFIDELI